MGTREHLIQIAAEIIKEAGFEGLTTAALAKRAGVAEGTMYRHFPSKEALVEAVFDSAWQFLNAYMEAHLPPRSEPRARLDAFFHITLAGLQTPTMMDLCGMAHTEQLYYSSKRTPGCDLPEGMRDFVGLLEESIALAQEIGDVRGDLDPKLAALFIFSGGSTLMDLYADPHVPKPDSPYSPEKVYAQVIDFANRVLYRGAL